MKKAFIILFSLFLSTQIFAKTVEVYTFSNIKLWCNKGVGYVLSLKEDGSINFFYDSYDATVFDMYGRYSIQGNTIFITWKNGAEETGKFYYDSSNKVRIEIRGVTLIEYSDEEIDIICG